MSNAKTGGAAKGKKGGAAPPKKGAATATATAPKTAAPGEAPNGKLTIIAWSAFTVDGQVDKNGRPAPRWGDKVTADNVIAGATVAVLGVGLTSKGTSKSDSATTFDLTALANGAYTLRFVPTAEQLATQPAGPKLQPNVKATKSTAAAPVLPPAPGTTSKTPLPAWVPRMYRTIDLQIVWKNGALAQQPTVVDGLGRCRVIRFLPNLLEVDWKPEWVRAKNIVRRAARKTLRPQTGSVSPVANAPRIDAVVLHRTGKAKIGSSLSEFTTTVICSHYIIDVDGFVVMLVPDEYQGAHAGTGAVWDKEYVVNNFSIGIELVNESGPFPSVQMQALVDLLQKLVTEHKIKRDRVLGHCEVEALTVNNKGLVANNRNDCPGSEFDWTLLEKKGLALAPLATRLPPHRFFRDNPSQSLVPRDNDKSARYGGTDRRTSWQGTIRTIQDDLAVIGYEEEPDATQQNALRTAGHKVFAVRGEYDRVMERTVQRFQQRYMAASRNVKTAAGAINRATSEMIFAVRYAKTRVP